MNYSEAFLEVGAELQSLEDRGQVAAYIPELSHVDPNQFGAHLTTVKNEHFFLGDSNTKFSIQSIFKVLALTLARGFEDDNLWDRVGVEPSGSPFNSLVQLEYEQGIPRNPLINAGALVVCDVLLDHLKNPQLEFIEFVRALAGDSEIDYCPRVAKSERLTGHKNAAMINLIKSYGNITHDIDQVLDFYCDLCSIEMSCKQLAQAFLFLAANGVNPPTGEAIISDGKSKRINAIMQLCGFYDEAGDFAFKVGLPGKSGVGGGIIAVHPGKYSIAVWSPCLNAKGNSFKGMKFLELFTTKIASSIF
ncbi:MAG: glutaminase [Desulfuromusa sp.]|jgi:glutaminase|nr:glutaminase [Desulfuromusa sp.]